MSNFSTRSAGRKDCNKFPLTSVLTIHHNITSSQPGQTMFTTSDGTILEIKTDIAPQQRSILVVWPCMTGTTAMYRLPVKEFNDSGISVIQYNPRGHGRSAGQFELERCTADLREYIESLGMVETPMCLLGHSAGAFCILKNGGMPLPVAEYILVSPVLDSIRSYRHLYDNGHHGESGSLISAFTTDSGFMLSLLEKDDWMDREIWRANSYRERINAISRGPLIGTLMERLFLDGYDAYMELELHSRRTSIIMPVNDNWFPMDLIFSLAEKYKMPIETLSEAGDHYFTGAWKYLWCSVLHKLAE